MNKDRKYTSVFAPYLERFADMKEAGGLSPRSGLYDALRLFDRFATEEGIPTVDLRAETVVHWVEKTMSGNKPTTIYEKVSAIGQFCKYLIRLGIKCEVPVYPRKPKRTYTPYIYSKEEIHKIFIAADTLRLDSLRYHSVIFSVPILLRLLYSTGMRIGEACNLKNSDVDMRTGKITVRNTKNRQERLLPIIPTLHYAVSQYLDYRRKLPVKNIDNPDSYFLVNLRGDRLHPGGIGAWFHKILKNAGIKYIPGMGPRIHDLRHTFAVHTLDRMAKEGADVYCVLPVLSVALGHKCVTDTEYYVRITNQAYPDFSELTTSISEYIFPTIKTI